MPTAELSTLPPLTLGEVVPGMRVVTVSSSRSVQPELMIALGPSGDTANALLFSPLYGRHILARSRPRNATVRLASSEVERSVMPNGDATQLGVTPPFRLYRAGDFDVAKHDAYARGDGSSHEKLGVKYNPAAIAERLQDLKGLIRGISTSEFSNGQIVDTSMLSPISDLANTRVSTSNDEGEKFGAVVALASDRLRAISESLLLLSVAPDGINTDLLRLARRAEELSNELFLDVRGQPSSEDPFAMFAFDPNQPIIQLVHLANLVGMHADTLSGQADPGLGSLNS